MFMNKRNKGIAGALAFVTMVSMIGSPCFAFAGVQATKEETVYVITDSDGIANNVIVSDTLINKSKSEHIEDASDLRDIKNVKGDESFKQDGKSLTWDAQGNDIYYQGKSDKPVPVQMNLKYYMDGEEFTGEEIQGKKGNFKIGITYSSSSEAGVIPFIVISGLLVENEKYDNIKVSEGKVVDDGEKTIVIGLAAPGLTNRLGDKLRNAVANAGLGNTIEITGHTSCFDITDIMSIASCNITDDIDTSALGDLDYDDQIKELKNGSLQLVDGSSKLHSGISQLNAKVPTLQSGIGQLNAGAKQLSEGAKQLRSLKTGIDTITTGQQNVLGGLEQLRGGLAGSKDSLKGGLESIATGADSLNAGVSGAVDTSNGYLGQAEKAIEAVIETKGLPEEAKSALQGAKKAIGASQQYNSGIKNSVSEGAQSIKTGTGTMIGGIDKLLVGFDGDGSESNPGVINGMNSLIAGTKKISGSIGDESQFDSLIGGAAQLAAGLDSLNSQTGLLADGIGELDSGSEELADGMNRLYEEGIKEIVKMYNNELKGLTDGLKATIDAGRNYRTFTQLAPGMDGSVKFVFKTVVAKTAS